MVAEQRRRSVVVLTAQPVASSAGDDVHGVADVEQLLVGGVDGSVGPVGQPGGGQSAQDGHVAQPAAGLLEVRLEEVGEVALSRVPLRDLLLQLRQPCTRVGAPVVGDGRLRRVDDVLLARDEGDVEQADGGRQVRPGHGPALVDGADAVVELHALVPDRVPEPVGQAGESAAPRARVWWSRTRSKSLSGPPSRRARLPTAARATPPGAGARGGLVPELAEPLHTEVGEGRPPRGTGTRSREAPGAGQVEPPRGDVSRAGHRIGPFARAAGATGQ